MRCCCCCASLWGASYTFIKIGVATIPPVTFIAARTLIAGLILLVDHALARAAACRRTRRPGGGSCSRPASTASIPFTLIAWAETSVDAGLAIILNSTTPIFTFLMTAAITRHEAVTTRKLFGVVAGIAGISLIIGMEAFGGLGHELLPQLAVVAATISYAGAAIFGRGFKGLRSDDAGGRLDDLRRGDPHSVEPASSTDPGRWRPRPASIAALLGLSVFSTALAFVIFFRLIHTLGTVGTTAQAYLRVPIGVGIGVLFLGETLSSTAWIGLAAVSIDGACG